MAKPRSFRLKSHSLQWLFCLSLAVLLSACERATVPERLGGATMGTTWSATYLPPEPGVDAAILQRDIEVLLEAVNAAMSTYLPDSEISRFNALPAGGSHAASEGFVEVFDAALAVGAHTQGGYDVTIGPLVELWGFGASTPGYRDDLPGTQEITAARALVGQQHIVRDAEGTLRKAQPVALDFSSLAKGYAVDQIAALLKERSVQRFLVEVGGEMVVAGLSPRDDPWQIAIEQPEPGARSVAAALQLTDIAVATSGDYRNFFVYENRRYSHTIDPRTGYPVDHELVSVTVLHPSAMYADAWATALGVMGLDSAMSLAQAQALAVYFIAEQEGQRVHRYTPAMKPFLMDRGPG